MNICHSLSQIGMIYYTKNQFALALEHYKKALRIREAFDLYETEDTGTILMQIGLVLCKQEKYEEALPYYKKSLEIKERILPFGHFELIDCLISMGNAYRDLEDFELAFQCFQQAKQQVEVENAPEKINYIRLSRLTDNIGIAIGRLHGEDDDKGRLKGLECRLEAVRLLSKVYPRLNYAQWMETIGDAFYAYDYYAAPGQPTTIINVPMRIVQTGGEFAFSPGFSGPVFPYLKAENDNLKKELQKTHTEKEARMPIIVDLPLTLEKINSGAIEVIHGQSVCVPAGCLTAEIFTSVQENEQDYSVNMPPLIVRIQEIPHQAYSTQCRTLHVPSINGTDNHKLEITGSEIIKNDTEHTIRLAGLPNPNNLEKYGDIIVKFIVQTPSALEELLTVADMLKGQKTQTLME
ncbi:unnamed protein product [Didymodactylos carnosus]|uniref:Tetratricopeptide repeat protein n=1 Tax=Didymodactylos carnosus TaxID=1234261 RepID=A0A815D927_9BILA|nr:unnamed protein product [Didymodactylos carnosus]CAF4105406.1 unnamed protein product [Didymodactylos carnosus]